MHKQNTRFAIIFVLAIFAFSLFWDSKSNAQSNEEAAEYVNNFRNELFSNSLRTGLETYLTIKNTYDEEGFNALLHMCTLVPGYGEFGKWENDKKGFFRLVNQYADYVRNNPNALWRELPRESAYIARSLFGTLCRGHYVAEGNILGTYASTRMAYEFDNSVWFWHLMAFHMQGFPVYNPDRYVSINIIEPFGRKFSGEMDNATKEIYDISKRFLDTAYEISADN